VETEQTSVPVSAGWLGGLGAVPFVGLAGVLPLLAGGVKPLVVQALLAYGATILSFLGGVHWGLAIKIPPGEGLKARLVLSVMPSLVAWVALLVGAQPGLMLLALAIAAMLWVDLRATRLGHAPLWYPKLRLPLSAIVCSALVFGALA